MSGTLLLLSALIVAGPPTKQVGVAADTAVINSATITVIQEADVPAQDAGQLREVEVRKGLEVERNQFLASLSTIRAEAAIAIAKAQTEIAKAEAESSVNIEVAKMTKETTFYFWQQAVVANRKHPNAISPADELQRKFSWRRSEQQVKQAQLEQHIARLTAVAREAELGAAQTDLKMRQIDAPIDGVIVDVYKKIGEWVTAGEPVVRIMRLDRLRVEGFLDLEDAHPAQVSRQPVKITVQLGGRNKIELDGRISFVKPVVEGKSYRVEAEVANRKEIGEWLLRPGMQATITIELKPIRVGKYDDDSRTTNRSKRQPPVTKPRRR